MYSTVHKTSSGVVLSAAILKLYTILNLSDPFYKNNFMIINSLRDKFLFNQFCVTEPKNCNNIDIK